MKPRHSKTALPSSQRVPPPQKQKLPGEQSKMIPEPVDEDPRYKGSGKLDGKVAIITGGDSGIGRATAIAFAKEGADVAIIYLKEDRDAEETQRRIAQLGKRCLKVRGDVGKETFCQKVVEQVINEFGQLDILVNNAAEQHLIKGLEDLSADQLMKTYQTNFFGYLFLTKAALPHLKAGASIINTTSIQAYEPDPYLMDYASTKGAILNFTRSLARELAEKGIRVNGVAPGPIWTPLIPASFPAEKMEKFGRDTPLKRPGQPSECAPSYVFLASDRDSSYMTGQILHPNGGSGMYS